MFGCETNFGLGTHKPFVFSKACWSGTCRRGVTLGSGELMRLELRPSVAVVFATMTAGFVGTLGWADGIWAAALITASVLLHEYGHCLAARHFGIR